MKMIKMQQKKIVRKKKNTREVNVTKILIQKDNEGDKDATKEDTEKKTKGGTVTLILVQKNRH